MPRKPTHKQEVAEAAEEEAVAEVGATRVEEEEEQGASLVQNQGQILGQ